MSEASSEDCHRPQPADAAAARVQGVMRGFLVRRREVTAMHAAEARVLSLLESDQLNEQVRAAAARRLQAGHRRQAEARLALALERAECVSRRLERETKGLDAVFEQQQLLSADELAARRLQSALRGFLVRHREAAAMQAAEARVASLIEQEHLNELGLEARAERASQMRAARRMQREWRRKQAAKLVGGLEAERIEPEMRAAEETLAGAPTRGAERNEPETRSAAEKRNQIDDELDQVESLHVVRARVESLIDVGAASPTTRGTGATM